MTKTPYRFEGKLFLYDEAAALVHFVAKMTKADEADNHEWLEKHGRPLYETIGQYMVLDSAGLRPENWKNKELRDSYLDEYAYQLDEELYFLTSCI